jgi:hypothetical protein
MMKQKKLLIFTAVVAGIFVLLSFDDLSSKKNSPTADQNNYEQAPPIASKIWVQQLEKPLSDGSTMIFQAQFEKGFIQNNSLTLYPSQETKVVLFDDGKNGGDEKAGDAVFSGFFKEDVKKFEESTIRMEENLRKQGQFIEFNGRVGSIIKEIPHFDVAKFDKFQLVDFNPQFLLAVNCGTGLLKQNSLLITDLSVVEDPSRTYNICSNSGNPWGEWTFGTLAKGIAFQTNTGVSAKTLIRSWINNWMTNRVINGQNIINSHTGITGIPAATNLRENEMLNQVITPWLRNSYANPSLVVSLTNWAGLWNAASQDSILKYAPFKLSAIVNRLDLRGNSSYAASLTNAGETRFIFSAVNANVGTGSCGTPIANGVRQGFNVIFEYGNPQTNCNALKNFAQQWLDLSDDALGTTTFNDDLEAITKQVTDSGNGGSIKPNKSAINRIRTNEIALSQNFNINFGTPITLIPENRWQLLEFELNSTTHLFEGVGVKVTPRIHANGGDGEVANITQFNTTSATKFNFVDSTAKWVNGHQVAVQNGNINYPDLYPNSTKKILGASSEIISISPGQTDHFWDGFNPFVTYSGTLNVVPSTSITSDLARQQFSLNTCAGCHGGEARTVFTQIRYLGYGQPAIYWTGTPSFTSFGARKVDHVAPFLTGRKRTDGLFPDNSNSPSGLFADDNTDITETPNDDALDGLFYVKDIAGRLDGFGDPLLWALNDLERRKQGMCLFLNSSCSPFSTTFALAMAVRFQPLELGTD